MLVLVSACGGTAATEDSAVVVAAGDIACEPGGQVTATTCQQRATSDRMLAAHPTAVLTLGDEQYVIGRLRSFMSEYGPTWGRALSITHPAPGNHEYDSHGADGFFAYFGGAAGTPDTPWYSFSVGPWHVIALNSECDAVGGCGKGSRQERWLAADLAAHPTRCTLAFWHEPRFSSGGHGNHGAYSAFWDDLYRAGADLVLNGHDHDYERFAPQSPAGVHDDARGIREFVVGTGGKNLRSFRVIRANSQVRLSQFGVLELTLHRDGYAWRFLTVPGHGIGDQGSDACH